MSRLMLIFGLLAAFFVLKGLFKGGERSTEEMMSQVGMSRQAEGDCTRMDEFLAEYPESTPEEILKMEECNKERTARLGLDKPGTGFLGNTRLRPDGALAHYEGSGGRMFFTVYADHILSSESKGYSEEVSISFDTIKAVKKAWDMPGTINIEFQNESGNMRQFSITLFGGGEMRAEGATDLDRLIALLKKQAFGE